MSIGSVMLIAEYAAGQSWAEVIAASVLALAVVWMLDGGEV